MITALALLAVAAVLFAAAAVATRDEPLLAEVPPDAADVALPEGPVGPEDLTRVRFSTTLRGYRMSEVDAVLERLASELAVRDERIAALERDQARA